MITERSIKLLSSVMLISANRIKVLRLWLTCFEDGPIRILTFAWWMLKTRKTMVSWQAFPSPPPRAPLAFLSHLKLPFPSLSNACHAGYPNQGPWFSCLHTRLLKSKYPEEYSTIDRIGREGNPVWWCIEALGFSECWRNYWNSTVNRFDIVDSLCCIF